MFFAVLFLISSFNFPDVIKFPLQRIFVFREENILFFARDPEFVKLVFDAAVEFANRIPIRRLTFVPDARVWELIV